MSINSPFFIYYPKKKQSFQWYVFINSSCDFNQKLRTVYHWQSWWDDRAITLRIREIAETRIR
ncbi:Mobile element protein [Klebsiella pneumoniae IS10]|uniref:Mobile element protein n=2 Tax=Klebsiella TaxID=570 RepID=A0A2R4NDV6_KLEPN|nr:Mobile element protein [Klebsiella pneumoniae]AVX35449.1 Mobile element protein [Klebsiella aerogenes]CDK61220.1 Mobile element protein [Klebsiella pneumoniae IS10]AWF77314.1 Mobile element protein [Klebsiella pneumoniae]AWF78755.1 Mobile element protein [Klebsiella pneumoniae]